MSSQAKPNSALSTDRQPATKLEVPKDQPPLAQAASPIVSLSSSMDPFPHFIMTGACGLGALYSYKINPRISAAAAGFALAYFSAGRMLTTGHEQSGYDLGTITSLGLVASAYTAAKQKDSYGVAMAALGGVSAVANVLKSYQLRTGTPKEMQHKRH
ncbi:MAG: hypothetical protein WDW38_007848 [Sanguina aurantia]